MLAPLSRKFVTVAALAALALGSAGCARIRGHQGFIYDSVLLDSLQPGIDNRDSVEKTLGRPTFISQFGATDWYYVARDTKQLAFSTPKPVKQMVVRVRFDAAGNVVALDKAGLEKAVNINPENDKTPTLGRDSNLFKDLFGNIGTVGATSQGGGTADNPN